LQSRASILRLPVEITAEIFIHCLPESLTHNPRRWEAPLLLGRICSQWRDIALSTPGLWRFLAIYDVAFLPSEAILDIAEIWLSRSRSCPLFLNIRIRSEELFLAPLIAILSAHSARWCEVELIIPYTAFLAFAFPAGLPMLKQITVGTFNMDDTPYEETTVFSAATQLRQAHVLLTNYNESTPIFALPWAQLTSFTGTTLKQTECMLVLTEATALVDCHLFDMY
ncbi:hypothetical protein FB451DRAFT_987920, partial [Mycena latifolia]